MNNIARQEIYYGRYYSPKEIIQEIESITLGQIKDLVDKLVHKEYISLTVYGPVDEEDVKGIFK